MFLLFYFLFNRRVLLVWRSNIYPCFMFSAHPIWGCWKRHDTAVFQLLWFLLVTTKHFLSFAKEESSQRGTTSFHISECQKILTEEKKSYFDSHILFYQSETLFVLYLHINKCLSLQIITYFSYFNLIHSFILSQICH